MSRKIKKVELSAEAREALRLGYKLGETACYRLRNHIILLKSDVYPSKEIGIILGCSELSVHNWVKRYARFGLEGLKTKRGQGSKPKLLPADLGVVKEAVQQERQRLSQAKLLVEQQLGKRFSQHTLTRFLKITTAVASV